MSDTFESWKQETTRARASAEVCFDRALLAKLEVAEKAAEVDKGMLEAGGEVEAIREEIRTKTRTFVFESIGKRAWRDLMAEHSPSAEQRDDGLDHDPDTFPPAAMAATCVEPKMTLKQATWLCDTFPLGVVNRVWATVLAVNVLGGDEKKAGTARLQAGEKKLTQPADSESLEASS